MLKTRIFLDGEDVTDIVVSFWPDDGLVEVMVDGEKVLKRGIVEVRKVEYKNGQ